MAVLLFLLTLYAVSLFILLLWGFMTSFKDQFDFRLNILGLPKEWYWNYTYVFKNFFVRVQTTEGTRRVFMAELYMNTALYSFGGAFVSVGVTFVTAYLCALFPYKFSKVVYTTVVVVMFLPIYGSTASSLQIAKALHLYGNIWGQFILKGNMAGGASFMIFFNIFKGIPRDFSDAARIDGAGNLAVFIRILIPMASSAFFTFFLMSLIGLWNDYGTPLLWFPNHPTVALGLMQMISSTENGLSTIPMRMTCAMFALLPPVIIFAVFSKRITGNMTMGGIKG